MMDAREVETLPALARRSRTPTRAELAVGRFSVISLLADSTGAAVMFVGKFVFGLIVRNVRGGPSRKLLSDLSSIKLILIEFRCISM